MLLIMTVARCVQTALPTTANEFLELLAMLGSVLVKVSTFTETHDPE
jgi:hypothetical protein